MMVGGLPVFAGGGLGGIEAALMRIKHRSEYGHQGHDDVFAIAAMYAEVIARGHVFNDGNKRTGLTCALVFLDSQGILVPKCDALEEAMVDVAEGRLGFEPFADLLSSIWVQAGRPLAP